ncbi:MAG: ABC transporter substrate-binding protein [Roseburia sp.]|nr:ABC transporter substrate-binding protein [Roseburia sp.]MCM1097986.1 ABC transporter substrate-binding protein [Ruminococcus flavefaciens]
MKRKMWTKVTAVGASLLMALSLAACGDSGNPGGSNEGTEGGGNANSENVGGNAGISEDSPYANKGFDLSKHETIVMYAIGEKPVDMDKVMQELNEKYMNPWLNTTLDVKFLSWGEVGDKYSLLLTPEGDQVDLMYTSSWCNYTSEVANGGFKELSKEFLEKYLPYSYSVQAPISWDQVSISGKIYTIPKNNAAFNTYNVLVARTDLLEKYNITEINSWDSMKTALKALAAERENGIYANGQRGNVEFADHLWWQEIQTEALATGYPFMYYTHGTEALPDWEKDVFYKYTSQDTLRLYLEMVELAKAGVWSPDKINDSTDAVENFKSGKVASIIWNASAPNAGREMELAGIGTYGIFDVTPQAKAMRGSYADDTVAITAKSKLPERAALVMDCLKGFPEVNNLVVGGIEGSHYTLTEDGYRQDGPDASNYSWGAWAWGITGKDSPGVYAEDPRLNQFDELCAAKEYAPLASAFTFDSTGVEAELAVINGIVAEYETSFTLGMFGDDTEAKFNEMSQRLQEAGLDMIMEECKRQYEEFCAGMQ